MSESPPPSPPSTPVAVPSTLSVNDLALKLDVKLGELMKVLIKNGVMATINETIDYDTAAIVASELGIETAPEESTPATTKTKQHSDEPTKSRPPVIAVMGHVDHGKTSLLDAIRKTDVAGGEAGGITQHLSAYQIKYNGRVITFLDTPGHEAFSLLREHGAHLTDVALIVVAADDGVKPQTEEAIKFAQRAGVHIVVAINKVEVTGANVDKVKQQLATLGLNPEDWGGDTVMVEVSAKNKQNIDKLLEVMLLVVDIENLQARYEGPAEGTIIEAHVATGLGPVATLLVQHGELNVGDYVAAGGAYAKIRNLVDCTGKKITKATPAMPVLISGWKSLPELGQTFYEETTEKAARNLASQHQNQHKTVQVKRISDQSTLIDAMAQRQVKTQAVVVKADVNGSLDSILQSLRELGNDEVKIKVVAQGLGAISETDISLAQTAEADIIGFNVTLPVRIKQLAERSKVKIRLYKVIYELLEELRADLSGMLTPEIIESTKAQLTIKGVFRITGNTLICGGVVTKGKVTPGLLVRLKVGEEFVNIGTLDSVQREQTVAKEVVEGTMCGLNITTDHKVKAKEEDLLELFTREEKIRTL